MLAQATPHHQPVCLVERVQVRRPYCHHLRQLLPHLTTKRCRRAADWAEANNVKIANTRPTPDHPSHKEQSSMIRRYIIWRNRHAADDRLSAIVNRANVA
jgi:hypothetical protein